MKKIIFIIIFLSFLSFIFYKMYQSNKQTKLLLTLNKEINFAINNPSDPKHNEIFRFIYNSGNYDSSEELYKKIKINNIQFFNDKNALVCLTAKIKNNSSSKSVDINSNLKNTNKIDSNFCIINANELHPPIDLLGLNSDSMVTFCYVNQLWSRKKKRWVFIENCNFNYSNSSRKYETIIVENIKPK